MKRWYIDFVKCIRAFLSLLICQSGQNGSSPPSAFYIFKIHSPVFAVKIKEKTHFSLVKLLNLSRGNCPASQVIINIKEECTNPASNTFKWKSGMKPDQISSFTAAGMKNELAGDRIEVISKLLWFTIFQLVSWATWGWMYVISQAFGIVEQNELTLNHITCHVSPRTCSSGRAHYTANYRWIAEH